ncbi:putative transporter ESBP6 like protein [Verticillium longisporum]|nr:putative transporter ESBP6 like protein [Verticillium longisporum]
MTTNNGTTVDLQRGEAFEMQTDDEAVEHLTNVTSIEPAPPNGGYAWVCTLCVFLVNSHTWGINSSWAVIMAHYSNESTDLKASHFEYAIIGGLSISQALLCSPVATQCHKHLGMRATMLIGSFIIFVSLLSSSFVTKVWQLVSRPRHVFWLGHGLPLYHCLVGPTSLVFDKTQPRSGPLNLGCRYWRPHLQSRHQHGHRPLRRALDVPYPRRLRPHCQRRCEPLPPRDGRQGAPRRASRAATSCASTPATLAGSRFSSYAASVGMTPTQGSVANALLNLGLGLGRPLVGYFSDTVGRINMAMLMTALCAVVGMKKMAGTFGVVCLSMVLPTTFAEVAAIEMSVGSDGKDFTSAQVFVAFMFVAGALSVWMLRSWKIFDSETERPVAPAPRSRYGVSWLAPRFLFRLWHV